MALLTLESYDYSEDYLKDIEIEHFDESMSDMDCCMYMIAEGERMWNDIMKEMAVNELRHLAENGTEMIYEAADTDNFFTKIINWFKSIASKFAGWVQKVYRDIQDHLDKFKKYATKYEKDIKKGYELIPGDGIKMKKYYDFSKLTVKTKDGNLNKFRALRNAHIKKTYGVESVLTSNDETKVKYYCDMLKDKSTVKSTLDTLRAGAIGNASGSIEAKDFKKALTTHFYGEAVKDKSLTQSDIDVNVIIDDLKNCTAWKRNVADAHKEFKSEINDNIKDVKTFKKAVDKSDSAREAKLAYCKNIINLYKGCVSITATMKTVLVGAFGTRAKQSLAISKKLVALAKKAEGGDNKKEEKTNNESFTYQFEDGMNFFTSDLL